MKASRMSTMISMSLSVFLLSGFAWRATTVRMAGDSGSHTRPRRGEKGDTVLVTITALPAAVTVSPSTPPATATEVAVLSNKGPDRDAVFHMRSGTVRYEVWALPQLDKVHRATMWEMVEVDVRIHKRRRVATGWLFDCRHNTPPATADADFKTCDLAIHKSKVTHTQAKKSGMLSGDVFAFLLLPKKAAPDTTERDPSAPAWISCTTGCCTLSE